MIRSIASLKRVYRRYNAKYFDGRLPDDTVIYWGPHDRRDGCCYQDGVFHIEIDPACSISSRFVHLILIHEMKHIALHPYGGHGKKFIDEGRRLAKLGAYDRLI